MTPLPLRLPPGADLRRVLEAEAGALGEAAFVVAAVGSLSGATLRFAGEAEPTTLEGPFELLTLSGSLSPDGAHLHASVADAAGRVYGGHLAPGNIVRTTAEVLVVRLPGWSFSRAVDPGTGYPELQVRRRPGPS